MKMNEQSNYEVYTKRLCMTELAVQKYISDEILFGNVNLSGDNAIIGFLVQGSAEVRANGKLLEVKENHLFYIPGGRHLYSVWRSSPQIKLYIMRVISRRLDNTDLTRYEMCSIPELSNDIVYERINTIYELMRSEVRVNMIRALGIYYEIFADMLPYLKTEAAHKNNPLLTFAKDYIDKNCCQNFDMEQLASYCCISQSRLYHLFKDELDTTPLKYRNEKRIEVAVQKLRCSTDSMDEIAISCGIGSNIYFRKLFREMIGMTPSEYRSATATTGTQPKNLLTAAQDT